MTHDKSLIALHCLSYWDILQTKMITWACFTTIVEYICFVCANIIWYKLYMSFSWQILILEWYIDGRYKYCI
jgi:hypothetical protein